MVSTSSSDGLQGPSTSSNNVPDTPMTEEDRALLIAMGLAVPPIGENDASVVDTSTIGNVTQTNGIIDLTDQQTPSTDNGLTDTHTEDQPTATEDAISLGDVSKNWYQDDFTAADFNPELLDVDFTNNEYDIDAFLADYHTDTKTDAQQAGMPLSTTSLEHKALEVAAPVDIDAAHALSGLAHSPEVVYESVLDVHNERLQLVSHSSNQHQADGLGIHMEDCMLLKGELPLPPRAEAHYHPQIGWYVPLTATSAPRGVHMSFQVQSLKGQPSHEPSRGPSIMQHEASTSWPANISQHKRPLKAKQPCLGPSAYLSDLHSDMAGRNPAAFAAPAPDQGISIMPQSISQTVPVAGKYRGPKEYPYSFKHPLEDVKELGAKTLKTLVKQTCNCESYYHVSRAPNMFLLYRSWFCGQHASEGKDNPQLSKDAAEAWKLESPEVVQRFHNQAKSKEQDLRVQHPGYRYIPNQDLMIKFGLPTCTCGAYVRNVAYLQDTCDKTATRSRDNILPRGKPSQRRAEIITQLKSIQPNVSTGMPITRSDLSDTFAPLGHVGLGQQDGHTLNITQKRPRDEDVNTQNHDYRLNKRARMDDHPESEIQQPIKRTRHLQPSQGSQQTLNDADTAYLTNALQQELQDSVLEYDPSLMNAWV